MELCIYFGPLVNRVESKARRGFQPRNIEILGEIL